MSDDPIECYGIAAKDDVLGDPQTPPTPERLLAEAEQEIDKKALDGYGSVIRTLRDKKRFSYREIAEWLSERGVTSDHNAVYRAYMRNLTPNEREDEEKAEALGLNDDNDENESF
jgi:hypothetical protein